MSYQLHKDTLEVLVRAKARIQNPEHWTKGRYARDEEGEMAQVTDTQAVCFCGLGAVHRSSFELFGPPGNPQWYIDGHKRHTAADDEALIVLGEVAHRRGFSTFPQFNDNDATTHDDVMRAFDEAIALLEASQ